jgi:hypothetical protein
MAIRLVDGDEPSRGRVEVFWEGEWGTVFDDGWDVNDASVVCKQLGYQEAVSALTNAYFGEGLGKIWIGSTICSGSEESIQECGQMFESPDSQQHGKDVGVVCLGNVAYPVRLVNGSAAYEGRVEIQYSGVWGTVCENGWDMKDANVVCQQLGYQRAISISKSARYGRGAGHIWMDRVDCLGHERKLQDCKFEGWAVHECDHGKDVGVVCSQKGVTSFGLLDHSLLLMMYACYLF